MLLAAIQCFGANFIQQHGDRGNLLCNPDVVLSPGRGETETMTFDNDHVCNVGVFRTSAGLDL